DPVETIREHEPHDRLRAAAVRRPRDHGVLPRLEVHLELLAELLEPVAEEAPVRVRVVQIDVDVRPLVDQRIADDPLPAPRGACRQQEPRTLQPERAFFETRPDVPAWHDEKSAHWQVRLTLPGPLRDSFYAETRAKKT